MIEPRHIPADDLALYAMQFLTPEEAAVVQTHLRTCPDCRRELATIQGDLAAFAHTAEMQSPPTLSRQRLMTQVGHEKKAIPAPEPMLRPHHSSDGAVPFAGYGRQTSFEDEYEDEAPRKTGIGTLIFGWAGWAVAAGLAVGGFYIYRQREELQQTLRMNTAQMASLSEDAARARTILDALSDNTTQRVTLTRAETAPAPTGRVIYRSDRGVLLFLASNIAPVAPDKTYELWIIPTDTSRSPIAAGTFKPDARGNASIVLPDVPKGVDAKAFGVTIENNGGSQVPTLPIIMVGM
ncbi:anti-sigma factor [Terriglobus tenax]|uniref:anti-sigma factor n=1 Tax=Terriglobus tenax TaxID=1111115 RepID=UPI0021DFCEBB|nr:anti-sigma factor [Terriglobus tenax]